MTPDNAIWWLKLKAKQKQKEGAPIFQGHPLPVTDITSEPIGKGKYFAEFDKLYPRQPYQETNEYIRRFQPEKVVQKQAWRDVERNRLRDNYAESYMIRDRDLKMQQEYEKNKDSLPWWKKRVYGVNTTLQQKEQILERQAKGRLGWSNKPLEHKAGWIVSETGMALVPELFFLKGTSKGAQIAKNISNTVSDTPTSSIINKVDDVVKPVSKVVGKTDDVVKPIVSSVDDVNPFKGKYDLPDSYKQAILENHRLKNLKELNSKEADEVLENFITRINTPEGEKRMKELGILYPDDAKKFYKDLKIYADDNTYAYYSPSRSRIGMNPELNIKDHVTRHEIEHSVRDVINTQKMNKYNDNVGNFRYLFNRSKGKKDLADAKKLTTEIDDLLSNLELKIEPESVNWNAIKSERQGKIRDANKLTEYLEDNRRATNYFASGSEGNEKSAFLGEVQQYMMSTGIIPKTEYINITPKMIKQTMINAAFDEKNKGKYLRLFRIMKPSDFNYDLISKALNKMLSVSAVIGTGVGTQLQNQNKNK